MADQPTKIHPVDIEAPPTAPLMPSDASKSDKGDPTQQYPPIRRTIPVIHSKPPKKRGCCCRFFCWTLTLLLVLIILIAATAGILYLVFQPKLPKYSINRLRISEFRLNQDSSLYARFTVAITARNPNKKIGIYYENGSHISVYYNNTKLSGGSLPKFYQGHQNTTVLDVDLSGQTENANGLLTALAQQQQQQGGIPLNLKATVPVRVKLGKLKLMKVKTRVRCNLVVDSLTASNSLISIRTSSCKFRLRL
ncbi:NDR1/HIN1-like protein [Thalictrum thalictroides]|uniref:NDR1/HIN1-like protein n=1 Tax=Thalictrum thalictroides TaxID=46969 RepID=A0A7J6VUC5_THATH|nr:NDR1/HIN1-like protein [Thalictrum thalictroides]